MLHKHLCDNDIYLKLNKVKKHNNASYKIIKDELSISCMLDR